MGIKPMVFDTHVPLILSLNYKYSIYIISIYYAIDNNFEELTFVEAARIFKAEVTERPIPIHNKHHDQIQVALDSFNNEENLSNLGDLGAVKLGPNDKRAIAFISKQALQEFVSNEEKELIDLDNAIEAIINLVKS